MSRLPRPLLYELVGAGMAAYARAVHRVVVLGLERLRLEPRVVLVSTHLSDADVPVLAGGLYSGAHMWRDPGVTRPAFAVSNDLLLRGYLAGYPRNLPLALRRALWPIGVGPVMQRWVRCMPVCFADRQRLVEALRARPDLELADALAPALLDGLSRRAAAIGQPPPRRARDVLSGSYADLLWEDVDAAQLDGPPLAGLWEQRLQESAADLRGLVRHVRDGGALIIFPHGERSPDGAIAPLDARAVRLLHVAHPDAVQPLAIAHDPLTRLRPRAFFAIGEPLDPPGRRGGERELLAALRRTTPLTAGLIVAHALTTGTPPGDPLAAAVDRALEEARAVGRPIEPALEDAPARAARVAEAARAVRRLGADHEHVRRAALTYATMVEPA
jgi:1-acyl-sn-glycerol-3-phosphate acyltransferase